MWWTYALCSAFFAALTALLVKLGVKGVDTDLATAIRTVVILFLAWVILLSKPQRLDLTHLSTQNWMFLVLSGLATGLSWIFYFKAMQSGPAVKVAMVDKLSVPIVLLLAALFLREPLTWKTGLAALLIVSGTLLAMN